MLSTIRQEGGTGRGGGTFRDEVLYEGHVAGHSATHAASESDNIAFAVAEGRDAMERALHPCSIIATKSAYCDLRSLKILVRDLQRTHAQRLL